MDKEITVYNQRQIDIWWLVAQVKRISAPFEQVEKANGKKLEVVAIGLN